MQVHQKIVYVKSKFYDLPYSFLIFIYVHMREIFTYVYMWERELVHVSAAPADATGGGRFPWSYSYRQL